ncbi:hypothetical protein BH10ACT10_BH10ACT10_07740 [soil metagenome]
MGQTQSFSTGTKYDEYRIGGTSVAAPLMAGMAAVADQTAGHPLGFLNPRIYSTYTSNQAAYYDVDQADLFGSKLTDPLPSMVRVNYVNSEDASGGLAYSLRTQEEPSQTLHSTRGYDTATGRHPDVDVLRSDRPVAPRLTTQGGLSRGRPPCGAPGAGTRLVQKGLSRGSCGVAQRNGHREGALWSGYPVFPQRRCSP